MFKIEKMSPPKRYGYGRERIYPFSKCVPGEGFSVKENQITSARSCLQYWLKTGGRGQRWRTGRISAEAYNIVRIS